MPEQPSPKLRATIPAPVVAGRPVPCDYAELEATSNFSFLRGASHPEELVYRAAELGYRAIAITDLNTLGGVVRANEAIRQVVEQGISPPRLIIGARLRFVDAPDVLVWALDRASYGRLSRLLTVGKRRTKKGQCLLQLEDLAEHSKGLLAAVVLPVCGEDPRETRGAGYSYRNHILEVLREIFDIRLSLAVSCLLGPDDQTHLAKLEALSRQHAIPLLATNNVHYHIPHRRRLQDVLTCIREGCTLDQAGWRLFANGERYLKPPEQMHRLFADHPQAIRRALEIAEQCSFCLDELRYEYPDELVPPGRTPIEHLAELTWQGASQRYPGGVPEKVRKLIEHELELIEHLRFEAYFLTVYDLVNFARSRGILCQGRGSAANSAVCYCLGITSVDPSRIDLLFERFVSAARNEPPDIDVDFEHERREEVIQYIYEKYGRDRAGLTAEVITYRGRSAVRDVGKALGLSLDLVDQMAKKLDWWHQGTLKEEQLRELGLDPEDRTIRLTVDLSSELLGFPRHLSQHVGGMVITRGPLCELVPIENAAMEGRTVIEWDKDDIDALGILKVDVLGLGMLTCISKALRMINDRMSAAVEAPEATLRAAPVVRESPACFEGQQANPGLTLETIPPEDPAVYEMIREADTVGVFQIESRAQMAMLPRLRPRCFYDLVIEVAIVRPGPIQGDMVHPYLRRRNGQEKVEYPSQALREVLEKTLGVPMFQEQAMRLAMVGAGFSAEEADRLRRAMAAWRRNGSLEAFRERIVNGMLRNGYPRSFAEQCFRQIRGFGEYGFPESHAASFALLVYVSAWLKRHYPAAFAAALLNSQPMGFYAPAQIVRDAREHGVEVRPVDVNFSAWDCTLEERHGAPESREAAIISDSPAERSAWGRDGPAIRLGLRLIKGLQATQARQIVEARHLAGCFHSIGQFHRRTGLPRHVLERLAEADAFRSLRLSRRQALWQVLELDDHPGRLFEDEASCLSAAAGEHLPAMSLGQEVRTDYQTAGLSLKSHPVALVREALAAMGTLPARQVRTIPHGQQVRVAGLVFIRQRPATAGGIIFQSLEDETGTVNLIIRPGIYERYRLAARNAGLLQAEGTVERQGAVIHVLATHLRDLSHLLAGQQFTCRDFH